MSSKCGSMSGEKVEPTAADVNWDMAVKTYVPEAELEDWETRSWARLWAATWNTSHAMQTQMRFVRGVGRCLQSR